MKTIEDGFMEFELTCGKKRDILDVLVPHVRRVGCSYDQSPPHPIKSLFFRSADSFDDNPQPFHRVDFDVKRTLELIFFVDSPVLSGGTHTTAGVAH